MFLQLLANGLIMGSIYGLVALGFAIIFNTTRIFHIAYSVLYVFAPYIIFSFYRGLGLPFLISFCIAIIFTIALSVLIEIVVYRPLIRKRASFNVILISSIGVMIIVTNLIAMYYGNETKMLNPKVSNTMEFGSVVLTYSQLTQLGICAISIGVFFIFLKYSKFGIKARALRDDATLCMVLGMNINQMRLLLFIFSGLFAAIGAGLVSYDVGMDPYVGIPMFLNAVVALVIGGMGRFEAPIIGGMIIGMLQSVSVWAFSARWQDAVTFTLLIIFLLFRPQGILGEKKRAV